VLVTAAVPVTLRGAAVTLEPMDLRHVEALARVGLEPELWRWIPSAVSTAAEMRAYVEKALDEQRRGVSLPFVIVTNPGGQTVGSTRYGNIDLPNRRLEIGWTWVTPAFQRTAINTEAKLLLLTHAFEQLGVNRVELKTDALNQKSRSAITRLGAVEEGTFRKHIVTTSGRVRDTVYYSIIDTEWPAVKRRLETWLLSPPCRGTVSPPSDL
jgi:RimJ/RimL family protein N-acetyltransferase